MFKTLINICYPIISKTSESETSDSGTYHNVSTSTGNRPKIPGLMITISGLGGLNRNCEIPLLSVYYKDIPYM